MVNAWSLAHDVLNGTLDENFPIMTGNIDINTGLGNTASTIPIGGDDYADADYITGFKRAVDQFVKEKKLKFEVIEKIFAKITI